MGSAALQPDWRAMLTDDVLSEYETNGVIFLPQALHPEWLMLIELGMMRVMDNTAQTKHRFFQGQPGEFIETVRNFDVTPEIQRLLYDSPIADMLGVVIGSDNVWLYSEEFFIKEGGNCARTPWHQDMPYWPLEGSQLASMWITLDALPREETLEFVRGSHRQTRYDGFDPGAVNEDPTRPFYGADMPPLPDIEAERDKWDIVSWDITPGDVVIFHPGLLHGGGPTSEGRRRRTITVRCYGDDVVYAERPPSRPTVPLTPGLSLALKPGDPLRHPYYSRLRPLPEHQRAI